MLKDYIDHGYYIVRCVMGLNLSPQAYILIV